MVIEVYPTHAPHLYQSDPPKVLHFQSAGKFHEHPCCDPHAPCHYSQPFKEFVKCKSQQLKRGRCPIVILYQTS
jgi:hypothetical protein